MTDRDCVAHITASLSDAVEGLLEESRQWSSEHWLYVAESKTRQVVLALGGVLLQCLVDRKGTGHVGQWHEDASGTRREFKEYRTRTVQTLLGSVSVRRATYRNESAVPQAVVPLDGELGLGGAYSEGVCEVVAFSSAQLTYAETAELVEKTLGIRPSVTMVQRTAADWGERARAVRPERLPKEPVRSRMAVGVDGAMVRTAERRRKRRGSRKQHFDEAWREAKVGTVYSFDRQGDADRDKRYMASLRGKDAFGQQLWEQIEASGADRSAEVVWLGDGAEWIWSLKQEHLPHAVEILDSHHATDHLRAVGDAIWRDQPPQASRWLRTQKQRLLDGRVRDVLRELRRHARSLGPPPRGADDHDPRKVLADNVRYFENNAPRMRYHEYRRRGYPIGSGVVESACGHVVGQRLKMTSRMSWSRHRADAVLQLRCLVRSKQWDDFWPLRKLIA